MAAISAVTVAVLSALFARVFARRDRRRQMYGEAFRAALEWREMLYRVRRRDNTDEGERVVIDKFHDLQERLDYYEGWIGSESKYMRRSYRKLIQEAKKATRALIRDAWDNPGKKGNSDSNDEHPMISPEVQDGFLRDVRHHLSLQPWRWVLVTIRNWREV
ncbi:hypothetical protein [Nocardia sp. alder85J]|uniref:hypothetical protein n=1 Tax=Nocardia sp. alder85J TaxID=2862949 RepID=UPI001CD1D2CA|nr:hypothetical protein [Nocardia sp. alder85J]MCX4097389.1 hypothetical protein [Nocardia sp. alder85J]